ncbi:ADP-ribosylglycohydrolase family protein [Armatimonas rosea]|uniref:ADP-ribosylglycohydrolase n=1 Tax=Armatimonas rosea TaxID=685828 RepID=A0A7W9SRC7_ARMRO|nr:ADP-ribosylglycohydrolase family protein [Armatimonas rosea]MBB6050623.1 ADP-ribosylglycohydrolase [Armatimonas rosea]
MSTTKTSPRLLLSIAVGDAYGAGFEFESPEVVARENDGRHYRKRAGFTPGHYTDDTQMTLAIWEAVRLGEPFTPRYLADRFVFVYHRDPRPGYARGFEGILKSCKNGSELLEKLNPTSDRNGAAMRSVPLGLLPSITKVKAYAKTQAAITHNTPGGIASSQAVGLMAHFGLKRLGKLSELAAFLEKHVPGTPWSEPWHGEVPLHGLSTARAALTALLACRTQSELLRTAVAFTGDTDSVAAIALGCSACFPEYKQDLPRVLIQGLENGPYGRDYLTTV